MTSSASGGPSKPSRGADPLIGKVLDGRYRLEAVLGTGGVGVVYRGVHLVLNRSVAIKILHEQLGLIDELRKRFEREAQVLSALSHPHIVALNDYGIHDNMPYLVMELLVGRTVADFVDDDGPPDPAVAVHIARQMLRGLAFAHARGIVHRDLKAANVFLVSLPDAPHHVKILDFGLAKMYASEDGERERTLTKNGTILGTPAYMSPEQASGSTVDERTDVYSAGVVLFELLTGRYPFQANTRADMLRAHMLEPLPTLAAVRPGLEAEPELQALIKKAMAKERADRYVDAQAMLDALDALPKPAARYVPLGESGEVHKSVLDSAAGTTLPVSSADVRPPSHPPERTSTERLVVWPRTALFGAGALLLLAVMMTVAMLDWSDEARGEPQEETATVLAASTPSGDPPEETAPEAEGEAEDLTRQAEEVAAEPTVAEMVFELDDEALDEEAEPEGVVMLTPEERAALPAPYDPFERVLPQPIRRYHLKVRAGRSLRPAERRALTLLQRRMQGDPRPTLVLAHHYVDINFYSDALTRYQMAFTMDPAVRGDGRMLRDVVRLSGHPTVGDRAADMVLRIYGEEALPEVERRVRREMDPEALDRFTLLRNRLRGEG